jgi:hypothetical protein
VDRKSRAINRKQTVSKSDESLECDPTALTNPWRSILLSNHLLVLNPENALQGIAQRIELFAEPTLCALGPLHCAAAVSNQAWFYHLPSEGVASPSMLESHKEFPGSVREVRVSKWVSFLFWCLSRTRPEFHLPSKGVASSSVHTGETTRCFQEAFTR